MFIGPYEFTIDLVIVDMPSDNKCPIIFGRSFLIQLALRLIAGKKLYLLSLGKKK
jgi:hypothetical protein